MYLCPHRIEKYHPDFDPLLQGILESDGEGFLVILTGQHLYAVEALKRRLERTLGTTLFSRIHWIAKLPAKAYYQLLTEADVVLDAPHYSSSLTGHDAFSMGTPIVTLPGRFKVERYAMALYHRMGMHDLIATDAEDYVRLAVRVACDRDFGEQMRSEIHLRRDCLFNDDTAIRNHEDFFEHCLREIP